MPFFDSKSLYKREFFEGVTIFKSGDEAKEAYLIEKGTVQICREENGIKQEVALLGPGAIFGEMALIKKHEHTCMAIAQEKSLLVVIEEKTIKEKLKNTDPLIKALLHLVVERLYSANDKNAKTI